MNRSDFVAVIRHPRSSVARRWGKLRAWRKLRRYYCRLRRQYSDSEMLWDRLEHWAQRQLNQAPPVESLVHRRPEEEERVGFRAVLRSYARRLSEYAMRFPYEPDRRVLGLEEDFSEAKRIKST